MISVKAYAKLNLTLDVGEKQDKFHPLDSLVTTVDVYDTILLKKRKDSLVNVFMRGKGSEQIPPEQNNAVKAAELFQKEFSTSGVDITILKDIPLSSGMGGSSADIAGVLSGMKKLFSVKGEEQKIKRIADSLGSDAGYQLVGGFARIRGRGEQVHPLEVKTTLHFLLFFPPAGVNTAECFSVFDQEKRDFPFTTERAINALQSGDFEKFASFTGNHLESAALSLNDEVRRALEEGNSFSPPACHMTGSGSTVYLLFENEEFCRWAKSRYRGKCRTRIAKSISPFTEKTRSLYSLTDEEINLIKGEE